MLDISDETEALVRRLAKATGRPEDLVIRDALAASARALGLTVGPTSRPIDLSRLAALQDRIAAAPMLDNRTPNEILDEAWGIRP